MFLNNKNYDVVIIGAGTMGMAAGYFLARRGVRTLLIDAFDPPHSHGSHHGDSRMIRHAYGEGREYVALALKAQELWEALEKEAGTTIFCKTGVLGLGGAQSAFIQEVISASEAYQLPIEILSGTEIRKRWPGITVPDDFTGCLELNSGFIYSERAIAAYKKLAIQSGADFLPNTPVTDIAPEESHVKVTTGTGDYFSEKVLVTAGAWNGRLLGGLGLPLEPRRKVFGWFDAPEDLYGYEETQFPSFYLDEGGRMFYGFPSLAGSGLKLGRTDDGQPIDPGEHIQNFGAYPEDEDELRSFLSRWMPGANGKLKRAETCLQTWTPDSDFIIDQHPESKNIWMAAGFSGHGFKFGSVLGEILSKRLLDEKCEFDLSPFDLSRFK